MERNSGISAEICVCRIDNMFGMIWNVFLVDFSDRFVCLSLMRTFVEPIKYHSNEIEVYFIDFSYEKKNKKHDISCFGYLQNTFTGFYCI